jgi:hypothetical protein
MANEHEKNNLAIIKWADKIILRGKRLVSVKWFRAGKNISATEKMSKIAASNFARA